jgi:cell division protein FtsB
MTLKKELENEDYKKEIERLKAENNDLKDKMLELYETMIQRKLFISWKNNHKLTKI